MLLLTVVLLLMVNRILLLFGKFWFRNAHLIIPEST